MTPDWQFSLTDHCCKSCGGRCLVRNSIYMCSVCETMCVDDVRGICACGMTSVSGRPLPKGLKNAYRCAINPNRSVVNPARIIVLYGDEPAQPLAVA